MSNFRIDHKVILDKILLKNPFIRAGKMFGYPAYYVGKKLCICLYEDGVGVKLPQKSAEHLLATDDRITCFQPMGKSKMREWIQVNVENSDELINYQSVFDESIEYLLKLQNN